MFCDRHTGIAKSQAGKRGPAGSEIPIRPDVDDKHESMAVALERTAVMGLPRINCDALARRDWKGPAINDDLCRSTTKVKEKVALPVRVRHHPSVEGIETCATKITMRHSVCKVQRLASRHPKNAHFELTQH
jgi:hypothetical protein